MLYFTKSHLTVSLDTIKIIATLPGKYGHAFKYTSTGRYRYNSKRAYLAIYLQIFFLLQIDQTTIFIAICNFIKHISSLSCIGYHSQWTIKYECRFIYFPLQYISSFRHSTTFRQTQSICHCVGSFGRNG